MYAEATIQSPLSCKEAFYFSAQTITLSKSGGAQAIKEALERGTPLSLLEDVQHDLTSKGWAFPPPLDPNNSKALHNALNRGAVTVALESSITPEIGYKLGEAILARLIARFFITLINYPDIGTYNWPIIKRSFVKTNKISKEEMDQFEQELYQVIRELEQTISAADNRNIVLDGFSIVETQNNFFTYKSGHRHKRLDGSWIDSTYTVYGTGTLFETPDGKPSAAFPGQALLLPERTRNYRILRKDTELALPLHATPRVPGRRLVILLSFRDKS